MDAADATPADTGAILRARRRRRGLLVAGAVLGVLTAAFLAWRLIGGPELQRLAGAADATVAAGTALFALTATVEGVPVISPFALTAAEGELDLEGGRARLTREMPGVAAVPFLDRLLPEPVQLVHDGAVTYLRLPLEGERVWVRLTGDAAEDAGSAGPGLSNPAAALGLLRALEGSPELVGAETVRGQPSTRYRVVVDLARASGLLAGRAADVARGLRRLRGRDDLTLDVWLDSADRVTRLRYVLEPEVAGTRLTLTTDLELYEFGAPVDIQAPQRSELVEVPFTHLRELDPLRQLREFLAR